MSVLSIQRVRPPASNEDIVRSTRAAHSVLGVDHRAFILAENAIVASTSPDDVRAAPALQPVRLSIADDHITVDVAGDEPHAFGPADGVATLGSAGEVSREIDPHRTTNIQIENRVEVGTASNEIVTGPAADSLVVATPPKEKIAAVISKEGIVRSSPCIESDSVPP